MELKVIRLRDGIALSGPVPRELASSASLELFPLRDGAYLLTAKGFVERQLQQKKTSAEIQLSEKEKSLVRKLLAIKFESRLPAEVSKILTREEKELLSSLLKKNVVQVFHRGKYEKSGVYNISEAAFNSVREPHTPVQQQPAPIPISVPEHLEKFGWMVLENESEARNFALSFPDKVKSGEVMGQRAFDRRYYFITKAFLASHEREVLSLLGKAEKTPEELGQQLGLPPDGCRAILVHLLEAGEVMEKRKGKFSRA